MTSQEQKHLMETVDALDLNDLNAIQNGLLLDDLDQVKESIKDGHIEIHLDTKRAGDELFIVGYEHNEILSDLSTLIETLDDYTKSDLNDQQTLLGFMVEQKLKKQGGLQLPSGKWAVQS